MFTAAAAADEADTVETVRAFRYVPAKKIGPMFSNPLAQI
jgi:hypothetical protein